MNQNPTPLTAEQITIVAAGVLAFTCDAFPGIAALFDRLSPASKRLLMAALTLFAALGAQSLACIGALNTGLACDLSGFAGVISLWLTAISVNQATHLITKVGARG